MVYIRAKNLPELDKYVYGGIDKSLVSRYVLKPFYSNVVLPCFPLSMAPNLITLSGFTFVIANVLTMLWYSPTLDVDCPPWVYYSWGLGLFLYQTFDAVDGSQARRTGQSGPLGELFDHGVDALNTCLEVILFAAAMNFGQSWKTVLTLFASLLTFYVQTWEEYHTKTLTLGLISGPVEGILVVCMIFGLTGYVGGGSFWQQPMLPYLGVSHSAVPFLPESLYKFAWNDWYLAYGAILPIFNTFQAAQNVLNNPNKDKKRSQRPLLGLVPFFVIWTLIPTYLYLQPKILNEHLVPFLFFAGIVNAYSVGQMIIAHLTNSRFPYWNVLVAPVLAGVIDSIGPLLQARYGTLAGWPSALGNDVYQVAFVFCCLGLAIGVYGSFVFDVIVTICDYKNIWCLTIKPKEKVEASKKDAARRHEDALKKIH